MSAVRRGDRRSARNQQSSPYSRPNAQPKKSSWSLSGLFNFLNPLHRKESEEEPNEEFSDEGASDDEKQSPHGLEFGTSHPPEILSQRGHAIAAEQQRSHEQPLSPFTPARPLQNAVSALASGLVSESPGTVSPFKGSTTFESPQLDIPSQSPAEKLEAVKQYLRDRSDQPLHHVEYVGLVSLLKDSVQDDDSQPFRFSTSPTPSRGTTPALGLGSPTSSQQTPRRTLTRNPNGVYKWQGAGSARPRNRHQSPAFGPARTTPSKFKLSVPEPSPSKADTKRRRLDALPESPAPRGTGESSATDPPREQPNAESSALFTSSGSSSSYTSMNDWNANKSTTVPSTPRLRLSAPPKPTAPAVPSPLRNTWGTGESSSPPLSSSPPSKPSQPTRAANFMAELIKEVTPPKRPDLSNPYQTASPVKPSLQKKPAKKRKHAEERPKQSEKKEVDLSHQTIIEATIPTGSKRSRPPQNIGKAPAAKTNGTLHPDPPRRSARLKSPSPPRTNGIHTATDEQGNDVHIGGDAPASKRQKKAPQPTVEDVPDVDMHSPTSPTSTTPGNALDSSDSQSNAKKATPVVNGNLLSAANKAPFPLKSSAPKEPSKLRFGFAAESDPDSPPPTKSVSDTPAPALTPDQPNVPFSLSSPKPPTIPSRPTAPTPTFVVASPLPEADPSSEPHSTTATPKDPKQAALRLDTASLPSFSFNVTVDPKPLFNHAKERGAAVVADSSSLPTFAFVLGTKTASTGFNWEAAGMKAPMKAADSWKCPVCMINNDSSKTTCGACEEPRPESAATKGTTTTAPPAISGSLKPLAPTGGFNWSAAGLKAPTKAPGTWKCQVCLVDNDPAKAKCVSCEEPRPASAPAAGGTAPTDPSGGFNWGAAGLKPPTKAPGTWSCKTCMVDNDVTKTKCAACEEPRA